MKNAHAHSELSYHRKGNFRNSGEIILFPLDYTKGRSASLFSFTIIIGSSMIEAGIKDGDCVLLHKVDAPKHNKIMLVKHGDESTLKRIKLKNDQEVYMCLEDGSGRTENLNNEDYEIQGEFMGILRG